MKKLKEKPFALIGVNINNHEPAKLKDVMTEEKLNWRSFADQGTIFRQWNSPGTPTFYVIDDKGTIRHKWIGHPGEKLIDTALEGLIREVEKAEPQK